jgi:electron transfer flavoprotein alpha subunit
MRIAALIKQIPKFEALALGPDGRLVREGLELEMNPYCRRAVAQATQLAVAHGGTVTVLTLGPATAEDSLREAIAWGLARGVDVDGVLVSDAAFAGSDTLASARALSAALERLGPFDLVLTGRNSVDADTGQVPPEVAELLGLPFLTGVRHLTVDGERVRARCEHDDGWLQAEVALPAVLSVAERLIDPCKVEPEGRVAVPAARIRTLRAPELGPGPWGEAASPTTVGAIRVLAAERLRALAPAAPLGEQVERAVDLLAARGALDGTDRPARDTASVPEPGSRTDRPVGVVVEGDRSALTRELLGAAAELGGPVTALTVSPPECDRLGAWGADAVLDAGALTVEEDAARVVAGWAQRTGAWAVLAPSTAWGREVSARAAARLGAGLTGDAVSLEVDRDRLVAWKPAFGGALVAAVTTRSAVQLVTVRAGVLPTLRPRDFVAPVTRERAGTAGRVRVLTRTRDDDLEVLADARRVVGIGHGIPPDEYPRLEPLLHVLGAELAATRKVTDNGWLPRARQVGITGRSIAPRLYVAVGLSGRFNHMVGVRAAHTILAINDDPDAPVFAAADVGIVGSWRETLPLLVSALDRHVRPPTAPTDAPV